MDLRKLKHWSINFVSEKSSLWVYHNLHENEEIFLYLQDGQSVVHIAASEGKLDCLKIFAELENAVEIFTTQDKVSGYIGNKRYRKCFPD